jgi:predicted nucleic acid-binding protein
LEAAWQIGLSYRDQDFSLVDRTSFAVMRRLGIERAASFDDHFAVFRFGPKRRHAFNIVG